ncbi:pectate lyase [Paenibacillus sp. TRM 82003]|nr:pectate lyase [Paenibacillus sp. TRM 82003]
MTVTGFGSAWGSPIAGAAEASPVMIVEESFNGMTSGEAPVGFTASEGGGTVRVADVPDAANKSVYLNDTSAETNVILSKSFDDLSGTVTIDLSYMMETYVSSTKVVRVKGDGGTPIILETKSDSVTYRHADDTYEPIASVTPGQWIDFKIVADTASDTADVYVDGTLKINDAPFYRSADTVNFLESFTPNGNTGSHYIDDLVVTGTPYVEPEEPGDGGGGGEPQTPPTDGVYQAEDAVLSGAIIDNKHPGHTGTGFVDYNPNAPGGWIEWTVNVPSAGPYTLEFRYASGAAEDRPAEIRVNGSVSIPQLSFPSTGDFAKWETTSGKAQLKEGANVIRATATGANGGANIDRLRVHNEPDDGGPAPIVMEEVEVDELLGGLLMKKLAALGMLASRERSEDAVVPRIEFMSMLNDALGHVYEEKFPHLAHRDRIGEVQLSQWDAYVLEAAVAAGYVDASKSIRPYDGTTRKEAADMIAKAMQLRTGGGNGSVGAVQREGYMSARGGRGFGQGDMLTAAEASAIASRIASETTGASDVRLVGVHTVTSNIVAVTLNAPLASIDYKDIALSVPTGSWKSLNPAFRELQPTKGAAGTNRFGNTVLFFETAEPIGPGASYSPPHKPGEFAGDLAQAIQQANNLVSWQMDHGGWTKSMPYDRPWNGAEKKSSQFGPSGVELGAIDNNATINEIRFISQVYRETNEAAFRESVRRGVGFLLEMQYDTGGWPQVYPERGTPGDNVYYSNYVTYNDNAMINVLDLFDDILAGAYPFDSSMFDEATLERIQQAKAKGIDYILESQIEVDGVLTAWCAQHDPFTYEARGARAYEHPSISGSESVGIVRYLMSQEQTPEIRQAVLGALQWFDEAKLDDIRYVSRDPNGVYFAEEPGAVTWYRFYEIGTNRGIFSGRDGVIKYSIQEIEQERRDGYSWGGSYAKALLETAKSTGYFPERVYGRVLETNSLDAEGRTLRLGDLRTAGDAREALRTLPSRLVVAQDGSGDYAAVQAAVDAVPANNEDPVEIFIRNGVYKEVVTIPANKPFITMIGESAEGTVLTYDNYAGKERPTGGTYGTSGSASMFVNGTDFTAESLTIENSLDESSVTVSNKQAVALNVRGERHQFIGVRFIGNQDTLLTNGGTQYFYQCYIEGDVDFIFGGSRAVFEECVIHSLDRGSSSNNGYITAASTMITEPYGYLILNSKLTSDAAPGTVWLGRPWHPGGNPNAIASVLYKNTEMGAHIHPIGWTDMSGFFAKDARFAEYQSYGPGAAVTDTRPQLTDEEAALWTIENVLKGWNPKVE